jgi:hypothetical protein
MLKTIEVVFDGKAFVPTEPVDLPAGTKASVALPESGPARGVLVGPPPPPMTEEQRQDWKRLCRLWAATPLPWATVDEAIAFMRGRPWPEPPEDGS